MSKKYIDYILAQLTISQRSDRELNGFRDNCFYLMILCNDSNSQSRWGKSIQGSDVSLKGYYGFNKSQEELKLIEL